jgi:hypothetical protein
MRKALFLFHAAGMLFAADPPYFTDAVQGWAIPDLVTRDKVVLTPGTLTACQLNYSSPSYSSSECQLQGADVKITAAGKTMTYPLTKVFISELQYDPKKPSALSYHLKGPYTETLPDNTVVDTFAVLSLEAGGSNPKKFRGGFSLDIFGTSNDGIPVVAEIK